jgi:aromatic ring-opening dioxygenase catalytic subunit (LigB family)
MAKIVLGLGTSHSPMLSTPVDIWHLHADRDQKNNALEFRGQTYDYEGLKQSRAPEKLEQHLSGEIWRSKQESCQQAISTLGKKLAEVSPDVVVIVGDDQHELFHEDGIPAFAIFWGERIQCIPPDKPAHSSIAAARRDQFGEEPEWYAVESELGKHVVVRMMAEGFDVAQLTRQANGRTVGHAFTFVRRRIMQQKLPPILPLTINTYYPPNQPTAARCYAFGKALRRAIESWDSTKRVAVVASGGLSHFVVDEEFDRGVLKAMSESDEKAIGTFAESWFQSGNSEIKNWIAAAGALEDLNMELLNYAPAYRSAAGTGVGLAFAQWV